MQRLVWTYGLIAGGIMAVMMLITMPFAEQIGDASIVVGFTTMIVAFIMVYVAIRAYRDSALAGQIRFSQAMGVGLLVTIIASFWYVGTWMVLSETVMSDFSTKYAAKMIERAESNGASPAELDRTRKEMAKVVEDYRNPAIRVAYTSLEVFPVGLVVVLISAGVLSRRRGAPAAQEVGA